MNRTDENRRRRALATWIETRVGGATVLAITFTFHQSVPKRWLEKFGMMKKLERMKRPMKIALIRWKDDKLPWEVDESERTTKRRAEPLVSLTNEIVVNELRQLLVKLNTKLGKAYKRGFLKLKRGFTIEGDGETRHKHAHGFIAVPDGYSADEFGQLVDRCWAGSLWARERKELSPAKYTLGWVHYITKEGLDSLDVKTLHV